MKGPEKAVEEPDKSLKNMNVCERSNNAKTLQSFICIQRSSELPPVGRPGYLVQQREDKLDVILTLLVRQASLDLLQGQQQLLQLCRHTVNTSTHMQEGASPAFSLVSYSAALKPYGQCVAVVRLCQHCHPVNTFNDVVLLSLARAALPPSGIPSLTGDFIPNIPGLLFPRPHFSTGKPLAVFPPHLDAAAQMQWRLGVRYLAVHVGRWQPAVVGSVGLEGMMGCRSRSGSSGRVS